MKSLLAIAVLASAATAAFAEPPKNSPEQNQPAPRQPQPAEVVLASADAVPAQAPAATGDPSQPRHRVAPRITHCRCGDPQPDDVPPQQ